MNRPEQAERVERAPTTCSATNRAERSLMQIEIKNLKHRTRVQYFLTDTKVISKWVAEIRMGRKWVPFGKDGNGISKFDTKAEAEAAIEAVKATA
jgi:hypothetical protein